MDKKVKCKEMRCTRKRKCEEFGEIIEGDPQNEVKSRTKGKQHFCIFPRVLKG